MRKKRMDSPFNLLGTGKRHYYIRFILNIDKDFLLMLSCGLQGGRETRWMRFYLPVKRLNVFRMMNSYVGRV